MSYRSAGLTARRRGSVLIMVVTLLVLLALIGTAAMSTARIDRISSRQNVANVQGEQLVDSKLQQVVAEVVNALYTSHAGTGFNVPFLPPGAQNGDGLPVGVGSDPALGSVDVRDILLASRIPTGFIPYDSGYTTNPSNGGPFQNFLTSNSSADPAKRVIGWYGVSGPLSRNGTQFRFQTPENAGNGDAVLFNFDVPKKFFEVTYKTINGVNYPAMIVRDPLDPTGKILAGPFVAADTDGDGIADAVLVKMDVSPLGGVTWYYAVRVIDHGSALNPNIARTPDDELATLTNPIPGMTGGLPIVGYFPASIDLWSMLRVDNNKDSLKADIYCSNTTNGAYNLSMTGTDPVTGAAIARSEQFLTIGEAMWFNLGCRLDYPGYNGATFFGNGVRPFSREGDAMALANRFVIANPASYDSQIETALKDSIVNKAAWMPYLPNQVGMWFDDNFNFLLANGRPYSIRPFLTTVNPTRNYVVRHVSDVITTPALNPGLYPTKTNVNTATFGELWQSFYDSMFDDRDIPVIDVAATGGAYLGNSFTDNYKADNSNVSPPVFNSDNSIHPARMFRAPFRPLVDGPAEMTVKEMMLLRSAIAAANTISLRDPNTEPFAIQVAIGANAFNIFGLKPQPYITEVYLNNNPRMLPKKDPGPNPNPTPNPGPLAAPGDPPAPEEKRPKNPQGFAAIELHNPYGVDMPLRGWKLVTLDRRAYPNMTATPLKDNSGSDFVFGNDAVIPPYGYLVLWNYDKGVIADGDTDTAQYLPSKIAAIIDDPAKVKVIYLKTLHNIMDTEVVLMRPVDVIINNAPVKRDMPIDSFDATGIKHNKPVADDDDSIQLAVEWHYTRANNRAAEGRAWSFVYPGEYRALPAADKPAGRHQGTEVGFWNPKNEEDYWSRTNPSTPILLGTADDLHTREGGAVNTNVASFVIQIFNTGMPGPFKPGVSSEMKFPYGGFPRLGDVLQVPYIGSYTIESGGGYREANAVTMDSVFADDTDPVNDLVGMDVEDVGRFARYDFRSVDATAGTTTIRFGRLFEYFTVLATTRDDWLPGAPYNAVASPIAIKNSSDRVLKANTTGSTGEDIIPTEGLININTAHWRVLATLPLVVDASGKVDRALSANLARRIVYFRDIDDGSDSKGPRPHGPFKSIMELNLVPKFMTGEDTIVFDKSINNDLTLAKGDYSPLVADAAGTAHDFVRCDFEEKFATLTRISNLVTTRSDCFTAYVCVQGWQSAGTSKAKMVVQRRAAVIIDRSDPNRAPVPIPLN